MKCIAKDDGSEKLQCIATPIGSEMTSTGSSVSLLLNSDHDHLPALTVAEEDQDGF